MAAVAPAGSAPVIQDGWLQSCCCVTQKPRDEIAQWMLLDTNAHASPSCMQMLLCQCRSEERVASGIEDVPQLAGLAGATLQRAPPHWPTKGSVQTLKWCTYDKEKRVADLQVFGGFGGPSNVGLWTEPVSLKWHCLINLARCCVRARALERSFALRPALLSHATSTRSTGTESSLDRPLRRTTATDSPSPKTTATRTSRSAPTAAASASCRRARPHGARCPTPSRASMRCSTRARAAASTGCAAPPRAPATVPRQPPNQRPLPCGIPLSLPHPCSLTLVPVAPRSRVDREVLV